ncbi:hypothetical protein TRFO_00863 [Tritrichomonas foetus]|uniref:CAMK family protein kinase n=1 Tax=Tritrichomonas foetus TaxID=1144522 RepID=A0A1J4L6N0_9EUKA|nr:hypothetical protein TRFO_00863 [Tritrichomonas foetus]|eukprot:OHT17606.1 hypothetical protein TRFO_00863 [Tritrichomonas foetus]
MPNFHPMIQDLISKMIVVDPTKRLTISQVKKHPAFSMGLPIGYILPSPIPLPQLNEAVDPKSLNPQIYKTLMQIGYTTDEELNNDLQTNNQTMAKVFHYMITGSVKLEHLPWNDAQHHSITVVNSTDIDEADAQFLEGKIEKPAGLPTDPFHRKVITTTAFQPQSVYSMAIKVDWAISEKDTIVYDQEDNIPDIPKTPTEMMFMVQELISEFDCDWFHPDDLRIIAKTEAGTYITFDTAIQDIDIVTLFVHMNHGTPEQFKNLILEIREKLNIW